MATQAFNALTGLSVGRTVVIDLTLTVTHSLRMLAPALLIFQAMFLPSFFIGDGGYLTNISAGGSSLTVSQYKPAHLAIQYQM
jgi:hypothetical protein